jgi:hypothetical protein
MAGSHDEASNQGSADQGPVDRHSAMDDPRMFAADSPDGGEDVVEFAQEVDLSEEEGHPGGGSCS